MQVSLHVRQMTPVGDVLAGLGKDLLKGKGDGPCFPGYSVTCDV